MKTMNEEVFSKENVFGKGQANTAYAQLTRAADRFLSAQQEKDGIRKKEKKQSAWYRVLLSQFRLM